MSERVELGVPTRLAAFTAAVLVAGLLGAGLGTAVGPLDVGGGHDEAPATTTPSAPSPAPADDHPVPTSAHGDRGGDHG